VNALARRPEEIVISGDDDAGVVIIIFALLLVFMLLLLIMAFVVAFLVALRVAVLAIVAQLANTAERVETPIADISNNIFGCVNVYLFFVGETALDTEKNLFRVLKKMLQHKTIN